jgi:hypothetical protein
MHGDGLRGDAGAASLPPDVSVPLAAFAGVQPVPLPLAGATQSLACARSPGAMLPLALFGVPIWPLAPAALLGMPGAGMFPEPARGTTRGWRAKLTSANPANAKAQIGMRIAPRKPRMGFFLLHRRDIKALL